MADLTNEDVLKLARLARLSLSPAEVDYFVKNISPVLRYVEQLQSVDLKGIEPTSQVSGKTNSMRPDEVVDYGVTPQDLLKNVPSTENNQIKVKRMVG